MPAPLVELDQLDLSRTIVSRQEIREVLEQRGRFDLIDGILHQDLERELVVAFKEIRSDDWWVEDHIPGRPIFPGALMIETSAQLCSYDFHLHHPQFSHQFAGFLGMDRTRFRALVEPDCRLIIVAKKTRVRRNIFHYHAQGFVDGGMVFESGISGVVI